MNSIELIDNIPKLVINSTQMERNVPKLFLYGVLRQRQTKNAICIIERSIIYANV